jgi:hypothetical protein
MRGEIRSTNQGAASPLCSLPAYGADLPEESTRPHSLYSARDISSLPEDLSAKPGVYSPVQ